MDAHMLSLLYEFQVGQPVVARPAISVVDNATFRYQLAGRVPPDQMVLVDIAPTVPPSRIVVWSNDQLVGSVSHGALYYQHHTAPRVRIERTEDALTVRPVYQHTSLGIWRRQWCTPSPPYFARLSNSLRGWGTRTRTWVSGFRARRSTD